MTAGTVDVSVKTFENTGMRKLSRQQIKFIAIIMMTLNHIADVFIPRSTVLGVLFTMCGYVTMPVMAYFLVHGYEYTHSKMEYLRRLVLFALISEFPYFLVFRITGMISIFSIMTTLVLCFLVVHVHHVMNNKFLKGFFITILVIASITCDWGLIGPVMACLFLWAGGNHKKTIIAFCISALMFELVAYMTFMYIPEVKMMAIFSFIPVLFAGFLIAFCYDEKKKSVYPEFTGKFFYWYYPVHLIVIWLVFQTQPLWKGIAALFSGLF